MASKRMFIKLGIAAVVLVILAFIFRNYISNEYASMPKKNIGTIPNNTRLLVIAPHSDDETLGCAGFIGKVVNEQGTVQVVVVTNGDGSKNSASKPLSGKNQSPSEFIKSGQIRHKESLNALIDLGVKKGNIIFLGYPDGGTAAMWSDNWQENKPFKDQFTRVNHSPYGFSYRPGAIYAGMNEAADLKNIIKDFKPTTILYPHPDDHHKDHWATFAFVKYALEQAELKNKPKELVYLVHYDFWPAPFGKHPSGYLNPPRSLTNSEYEWLKLPLTDKERQNKKRAIQFYKSQLKKMPGFLRSFERRNELFAKYKMGDVKSRFAKVQIENPKSDYLSGLIRPSGGIEKIEIQNTGDSFIFNMHLKKTVNPKYTYILNLNFFNKNDKNEKVRVVISKGKVSNLFGSQYRLKNKDIKVLNNKGTIRVEVPNLSETGMHSLLLSAAILKNGKIIDRTAWRYLSF